MSASIQINELAAAMARAQAKMENPAKDKLAKIKSDRGSFEYSYADLAATLVAARKALSGKSIAIFQEPYIVEGAVYLRTKLVHASGQWIDCEYPVSKFAAPQQMGLALTYARKQALSAMIGMAGEDEDDDGAGASKGVGVTDQPPLNQEQQNYLDKALDAMPLIMTVKDLVAWWRKEAVQRGKLGLIRDGDGVMRPGYGPLFEAYTARGRELGKEEPPPAGGDDASH